MEYVDMRKISTGEARQIRRQVVRLKEMGRSGKEIEEIVGVRQNRISEYGLRIKEIAKKR